MINVFEIEKKIDDQFFIIKFFELPNYYLIHLLPFRIWELDSNVDDINDIDFSAIEEIPISDMGNITPLFILTNNCNLACDYCYADEGSYGCEGSFMSKDIIIKTFDGLYEVYKNNILSNGTQIFELNAVCFGGEPLLYVEGLQTVLDCQKELKEKLEKDFPSVTFSIKQHINSNGFNISDSAKKYIELNKDFIEMVFSFDGLNHDKHRLSKTGLPSSIEAISSIRYYSSIGINTSVTCCLQPDELGSFEENIKYILETLPHNVSLNFSFLRGSLHFRDLSKEGKRYLYNPEEVIRIANIIVNYIKAGYCIYDKKFGNLQERAFLYRCPAIGKKEFCVMPDGNLYPCHNFVDKKYTYGSVCKQDSFSMRNKEFDKYVDNRTVFDVENCDNCCMKSFCLSSFDCPSHSLFDLNDIYSNDPVICDFGRIIQKELLLNYIYELSNTNRQL